MTHLQRAAMASRPLTEAKVMAIYRRWRFASNTGAVEIGKLCESHERLRAELRGAEILLAENEKRIRELELLAKRAEATK